MPGLDIAGWILEKITGLSFEDYLQANICRPLGLENTSLKPPKDLSPELARSISEADAPRQRGPHPVDPQPAFYSGGSGLFTTADDFAHILGAVLNYGEGILSERKSVELLFAANPSHSDSGKAVLDTTVNLLYGVDDSGICPWDKVKKHFGLGYLINDQNLEGGRKAGSGGWVGVSGTTAWVDRHSPGGGLAVC
jgi:methyl acetate hydrolase